MDALTLAVVGAAYGTSAALGVSRRAWLRRSSPEAPLAALIACAVAAILTIVLQHRLGDTQAGALMERIEHVALLGSGPALLLYMRSLRGETQLRARHLLHFAPALAAGLTPAALAAPIELLLAHQLSYTVAAGARRIRCRVASRHHAVASKAVLGLMTLVHLAQGARIATRGSGLLVDLVPVTLSIALLGCGVLAVVAWVAGPRRPHGRRGARPDDDAASAPGLRADELLARLERLMSEERLYRRADLGLHDLAAALEVTPHRLSETLNQQAGVTLTHYLSRWRIEEAKRRLLDPAQAIYTIEAIGEKSGFGSRSGFYAVFARETGTTPTRYRAAHRAEAAAVRTG